MKQCENQISLFSAEASLDLANPSVSQDVGEDQRMTVSSGLRCAESLKISGPLGSLVRMLLGSSIWNSTIFSLSWKTSVTPGRRLLFRLLPSMRHTRETELLSWPTPTAQDAKNSTFPPSQINRDSVVGEIMRRTVYPTPVTCKVGGGSGARKQLEKLKNSGALTEEEYRRMGAGNGGQLNPEWVEWLMGFPQGWTSVP